MRRGESLKAGRFWQMASWFKGGGYQSGEMKDKESERALWFDRTKEIITHRAWPAKLYFYMDQAVGMKRVDLVPLTVRPNLLQRCQIRNSLELPSQKLLLVKIRV